MHASWGSRKEQLAFRGGRTSEERKLLFDYLKNHTEPLFDSVLSAGLLRRLAALNCSFPAPMHGLCMKWDFLVTCPACTHIVGRSSGGGSKVNGFERRSLPIVCEERYLLRSQSWSRAVMA